MHNSNRESLLPFSEKSTKINSSTHQTKQSNKLDKPNNDRPKKSETCTNFFVKFDDNSKAAFPSHISNESKNNLLNISDKFKSLKKDDSANKSVHTNLLNWELDDNTLLTGSKLKTGLQNDLSYLNNIPYTVTLEENKAYYDNNNNSNFASVNPLVLALIDLISKLNEHHLHSRKGIFYENKMKLVSFIFSNFQTLSMSDALMLCPKQNKQNCFNIFKLLELLETSKDKKLTNGKTNNSKSSHNEAQTETRESGIPNSNSSNSLKNSCLNIFGEDFEESNKHLIDKELLNSILQDKEFTINKELVNYTNGINLAEKNMDICENTQEDRPQKEGNLPKEKSSNEICLLKEKLPNEESPKLPEIDSPNIIQNTENNQFINSPEIIEHLNKLTTLIVNVLLRLCFSSIKFINSELIRCDDNTYNKFNISQFKLDLHISNLKARSHRFLKEIKNLLPSQFINDRFTEMSCNDLLETEFFNEVSKYFISKLTTNGRDFYDESIIYYDMIYLYYIKFRDMSDTDKFFMTKLIEFKLVMFDLICNLTLEYSKNFFNFKNIDAIFQPLVVFIENNKTPLAYPSKFAQKDPRRQITQAKEFYFKVTSFTQDRPFESLHLKEEPFNEKKYIKQKYIGKCKNLSKPLENIEHTDGYSSESYLPEYPILSNNQINKQISSQKEEMTSSLSGIPFPIGPAPLMELEITPKTPIYKKFNESSFNLSQLIQAESISLNASSSMLNEDMVPATPQFHFSPPMKIVSDSSNGVYLKKIDSSYLQNDNTDLNNNNLNTLISNNFSPNNSLINLIRKTMDEEGEEKKRKKQKDKSVFQRISDSSDIKFKNFDISERSSVFSRLGRGESFRSDRSYSRKRSSSFSRSESENAINVGEIRPLSNRITDHSFKKYRGNSNGSLNERSDYYIPDCGEYPTTILPIQLEFVDLERSKNLQEVKRL